MEMNVVILTKSSKHKGYCVAGINMDDGKWVRLVSSDLPSNGALFDKDMRTKDGYCCNVLDIVKVQVIGERPGVHQPENVLIDANDYWKKLGKLSIADVLRIHSPEKHQYLLGNEQHCVAEADTGCIGHSLIMIDVKNLILVKRPKSNSAGNKIKATFLYDKHSYTNLSVTDPNYYNFSNEHVDIGNAILIMSLAEKPFHGAYYKFIARIFPKS